jgi:phage-related protein
VSVAEAFVTLRPDTRGFGQETEQQVGAELEASGTSAALTRWARRGIGAGVVAAGAALSGGFSRALAREEAIVTFRRLGLDDRNIAQLTDGIDEALRGTTVTNPEGFALAGRFLATGFDEADIPGIVSTIADLAQVGNRDFSEMADVLVRAAGQGRITADELNRMGDVPLGRVAEQLGMTEAAFRTAVSAGEISAEAFLEAFAAVEEFSDAAKDETTRQAAKNLITAISSAAESLVGPALQAGIFRQALIDLRAELDKARPALAKMGELLAPTLEGAFWLLSSIVQGVTTQFQTWGYVVDLVTGINRTMWEAMLRVAAPVIDWIRDTAIPTAERLFDRWSEGVQGMQLIWSVVWEAVQRIWETYGQPVFTRIRTALAVLTTFWSIAWETMKSTLAGAWAEIRLGTATAIERLLGWFRGLPDRMLSALGSLGSILWSAGYKIIGGLLEGAQERWRSVTSWFGGLGSIIQRIKGPLSYDRVMLAPQGKAIIGGLADAMEDEWARVERMLTDRTGQLSQTFQMNPGSGGGIIMNGPVNVGNRDDLDEMRFAFRKLAVEMS